MKLIPLPAFQDNDLWFLHDGQRARGVDPGDAQPVMASLKHEGLELGAILVTHRPLDQIGGVDAPRDEPVAPSLEKLAALPGETRVCCTHQYTLSKLRFARAVEPGNLQLISYANRCEEGRSQGLPTVPSTITPPGPVGAFASRQWKNEFR